MPYIVYITDQCVESANKYGVLDKVNSLKTEIEEGQYIGKLDHFAGPFRKKRFERQQRLMIQERKIVVDHNEYSVIIFGDVFIRGGKAYNDLCLTKSDNKQALEDLFENLAPEKILIKYIKKHLLTVKVKEFARPSEAEYGLIYSDNIIKSGNNNEDFFICESPEWSYGINREDVRPYLSRIFETLGRIGSSDNPDKYFHKVEKSKLLVVYSKIKHLNKIFLAALVDDVAKVESIKEMYKSMFCKEEVDEEDLLRCSVRSYPSILLADESIWFDIENDKEANLALSPEEDELLRKVGLSEKDCKFPLFINGRAGSGKSTILYYIFAGYFEKYISSNGIDVAKPVLLSYSDDLVARSIRSISSIIKNHHSLRFERGTVDSKAVDDACRKCIQPFCRYLKELLKDAFPSHPMLVRKHIDHAEFRKLWSAKFVNDKRLREIGADLCWHVIRTYIKGGFFSGYLEPDDYQEMPERQKSVSHEKYSIVYADVWERWYKELTTGVDARYYDDQDLVRCILDREIDISSHSCVFCDEAQDFTRIELNLIFHLSLFTKKNVNPEDISKLPFVFAGDPFQTLNPTGFRWESIKADFYHNITETFRVPSYKDVKICYQELSKNYRSSQPIVKFCNSVQLYRSYLFGLNDVKPQEAWSTSSTSMPIFFNMEDEISWRSGVQDNSDVIIIVPCALGEELDFVNNDTYLKTCINIENDVPQNVVSAMRVKGLEFSRVVIFGFGRYAPGLFSSESILQDCDSDKRITYEYYLNSLYVAASRPRHMLFIIDDIKSREAFWGRFPNDQNGYDFIKDDRDESIWIDAIGGFRDGKIEDWDQECKEDPLVLAERFESQGKIEKSAYFLKTAAGHYLARNREDKYNFCLGLALRFEGKWQESEKYFEKAGAAPEALNSLWMGLEFGRILELGQRHHKIKNSILHKLALCFGKGSVNNLCSALMELREEANQNSDDYLFLLDNLGFGEVVHSVLRDVRDDDVEMQPHLARLKSQIENLESFGFCVSLETKILLLYKVKDLKSAYKLYAENKDQSLSAKYPSIARDYILDCWETGATDDFSENDWRIVKDYFVKIDASSDQFWKLCLASKNHSILEAYFSIYGSQLSKIEKIKLGGLWIAAELDVYKLIKMLIQLVSDKSNDGDRLDHLFKGTSVRMRFLCAIWILANRVDDCRDLIERLQVIRKLVGKIDDSYAQAMPIQILYKYMRVAQYRHNEIADFLKSIFMKKDSFDDQQEKAAQNLWMINQLAYVKMSTERGQNKLKHQLILEQKTYVKKWNFDMRNFINEEPVINYTYSDFAGIVDELCKIDENVSMDNRDIDIHVVAKGSGQQINSKFQSATFGNEQPVTSDSVAVKDTDAELDSLSLMDQKTLNLTLEQRDGVTALDCEPSRNVDYNGQESLVRELKKELELSRELLNKQIDENRNLQTEINNLHKKNAELYEKYIKILESMHS